MEVINRIKLQDNMADELPEQEQEDDDVLDEEKELEEANESEDPEVQALAKKLNDLKEQKKRLVAKKEETAQPSKEEIKDMILGNLNRVAELMGYL